MLENIFRYIVVSIFQLCLLTGISVTCCFIIGMIYVSNVLKRRKVLRVKHADFPYVPAEDFDRWFRLEILSINVLLWATWGTFAVGCLLHSVVFFWLGFPAAFDWIAPLGPFALIEEGVFGAVFLGGLVISAVCGTKAEKLRKRWDIFIKQRPLRPV